MTEAIIGVDFGAHQLHLVRLDRDGAHTWCIVNGIRSKSRFSEGLGLVNDAEQAFAELAFAETAVFIENPPHAGGVPTIRAMAETFAWVGMAAVRCGIEQTYDVYPATWKKNVVGRGDASKADVAAFLCAEYPERFDACGGDQNLIDATCIAMYGWQVLERAKRLADGELE